MSTITSGYLLEYLPLQKEAAQIIISNNLRLAFCKIPFSPYNA